MDNTSALSTRNLTKRFDDVTAVDNVSFDVPRGVVFGYLGPNGAGKTTTIRMLLGLIKPSEGSSNINGFDAWDDREEAHEELGFLPGDFTAYPDLTSAEYLSYIGDLRGGVEFSEVEKLAERLQLRLDVKFGTLSHGNKQKVGIIQAFMHRPELLILDEPTSGLDPLMQNEFLDMVREVRAEGRTVFMSSHDLREVEAVADLIGMLDDGKLLVVDEVESLRRQAMHRIAITFAETPPITALTFLHNVSDLHAEGQDIVFTVEGSTANVMRIAAKAGVLSITSEVPDLEEIFLSRYRGGAR